MPLLSVTPVETSCHNLFLTNQQLKTFGLTSGSTINLHAGSCVEKVNIMSSLNENSVSQSVLRALKLPNIPHLTLKLADKENLRIGPFIGILVPKGKRRRHPPYSSQAKLLQKLLQYCTMRNYIGYVFFPEDVNLEENKIKGLYLETNQDGTIVWKRHVFPLPDVVYDRILHRTIEKKLSTKKVKSYLIKENNIPYFNPKFLDKWETHSILKEIPFLREHLPVTINFTDTDLTSELLEAFKTLYIKPVHGSLGQGIFRISATDGGYCSQHRKGKSTFTHLYGTREELLASLQNLKKNTTYVIQQGLDLLKYKDRVFDLRVLVQKDGLGQWVITAMVARVAPDGSIFPNIAAGGEAVSIEQIWRELYSSEWSSSQTYELTKQVSISAATAIENALGTFCEIGLDIGIDRTGNVWIIEINSKPSRKVFPKEQLRLKRKSLEMPMDFAAYLSGFSPDRELSDGEH